MQQHYKKDNHHVINKLKQSFQLLMPIHTSAKLSMKHLNNKSAQWAFGLQVLSKAGNATICIDRHIKL